MIFNAINEESVWIRTVIDQDGDIAIEAAWGSLQTIIAWIKQDGTLMLNSADPYTLKQLGFRIDKKRATISL